MPSTLSLCTPRSVAGVAQPARSRAAARRASAGCAYAFTKVTTQTELKAGGGRAVVELNGQARE